MYDLKKIQKIILTFNVSSIRSYELTCAIKRIEPDRLFLTFPQDKKDLMEYLREGTEVHAIVYTNKELYVFDSIVIDSPYNVDFVIELPEETQKIQHRAYQRVPINLNLKLIRDKKIIKTTTINIGGGGIRFRVNDFFENGTIWNFILSMPDPESIIGYGEVVYSIKDGNQNASIIKFIDINETDRSRIIKLSLDEEVKALKMKEHS